MNQQQFEAVIRNKIEAIGDGEKQRRYIYQSLRDKMLALAAKSPGDTERWSGIHAAFNAAVEAVEKGYETTPDSTPADAGPATVAGRAEGPAALTASASPAAAAHFRSPDETPKSAVEYFWIKVAAGCAALGGVLDFLKPIVDLQSPSVIVAALAAIALTVASRLSPARSGVFSTLRNVSLAAAAAVIGLFGLQSQFPGNAPNGAIAEVLPGLVQLQSTIEGLRAPIEKIGQDTGRIAETTDKMSKQLEEIAESSDGVAIAREAVRRAGHDLDADSLYESIVSNDGAAFYFEEAGFIASDSEVDAMLAKVPSDGDKFERVLGFYLDYGPAAHRRRVKGDLEALFSLAEPTKSVNPVFDSVCGTSGEEIAAWLSSRLSTACSDPVAFYLQASALLTRDSAMKARFGHETPYFMPASAKPFLPSEIIEQQRTKVAAIGYVDGLIDIDNYSLSISAPPYREWANINIGGSPEDALIEACRIATEGGMCVARIFFMIDSTGSSTFLGATDHAAGPVASPKAYAAAVAEVAEWRTVSEMRDPGTRIFAGAYDKESKLSVLLYCEMKGVDGASPGLSFRPDTAADAVYAHVLEPYPHKVKGTGAYFIGFNGGRDGYSGVYERRGEGVVDFYLTNRLLLEDIKNGRTLEFYVDETRVGQVSLAGFTAAYEKLRELTRCGW